MPVNYVSTNSENSNLKTINLLPVEETVKRNIKSNETSDRV